MFLKMNSRKWYMRMAMVFILAVISCIHLVGLVTCLFVNMNDFEMNRIIHFIGCIFIFIILSISFIRYCRVVYDHTLYDCAIYPLHSSTYNIKINKYITVFAKICLICLELPYIIIWELSSVVMVIVNRIWIGICKLCKLLFIKKGDNNE